MRFDEIVRMEQSKAAAKAAPEECACKRTEVRERQIRGGSKQFVHQCLDCGESVGSPVKQFGTVAIFDEPFRESYRARTNALRESAKAEASAYWWGQYKRYMEGPEWKFTRTKILGRDKQVCQGCLLGVATEVHHLSYNNFGKEFAFELISLCRPCHERIHAEDE